MRTALAVVLFAIAAPAVAHAQVTIPPPTGPQVTGAQSTAGCGPEKVDWEVTTNDKTHPTAAAEPAKAHIYLIQGDKEYIPHPRPSVRFGIDGQWVGATHSDSYFFVSVDPGDHRLCINWQGLVGAGGQRKESVLQLTAEAGQDYFVTAHDVFSGNTGPRRGAPPFVIFSQVNRDEALALMSRFAFATSTPKK